LAITVKGPVFGCKKRITNLFERQIVPSWPHFGVPGAENTLFHQNLIHSFFEFTPMRVWLLFWAAPGPFRLFILTCTKKPHRPGVLPGDFCENWFLVFLGAFAQHPIGTLIKFNMLLTSTETWFF
jgi:hypothetical protein